MASFSRLALSFYVLATLLGPASNAGSHLWVINEVYSNADGTVQFIEMWNPIDPGEWGLANKSVLSEATGNEFYFTENSPPNTVDKYILLATQDFADLPGAPVPDHIIQDNFFSLVADTILWHAYAPSTLEFSDGELPLDGVRSIAQDGTVAPASPKNWAAEVFQPPGVTAGADGAPLLVGKDQPDGAILALSWDMDACIGAAGYHVVYGEGSTLPSSPGGQFDVLGGACGLSGSPADWSGVPDPSGDPSRLLWFVLVAGDGNGTEGSWGTDSGGIQRDGGGPGGSAGVCSISAKALANTCGY